MIVEIRTRAVTPRVALAGVDAELLPDASVRPLRHCLGRFDREPMRVERFGVFVLGLELLKLLRCFAANGDDLERNHIDVA